MKKLVLALALILAVCGCAAFAADFPTKNIKLLVPFAAGGGTDAVARALASAAEKHLGQPVDFSLKNPYVIIGLFLGGLGHAKRMVNGRLVHDQRMVGNDERRLACRALSLFDEAAPVMGAGHIDAFTAPVCEARLVSLTGPKCVEVKYSVSLSSTIARMMPESVARNGRQSTAPVVGSVMKNGVIATKPSTAMTAAR